VRDRKAGQPQQETDCGVTRIFLIAGPGPRRESLEEFLDSAAVTIVGRANDLETLDEELAEEAEAILIDATGASLGDINESLQEARIPRESKVVLLVEQTSPASVNRAIQAGVRGIIPAEVRPEQFSAALEAVVGGFVVFQPSEAALSRSARPSTADLAEAVEHLTVRERDVLQMLSQGFGNKEIAIRLRISEHTVKFHVASILGKLDASTRTEAVSIALRRGLVLL
jgi:two-component system, NarL family, response regulator YdfI